MTAEPQVQDLLRSGVNVINVGVRDLAASLEGQGVRVVRVDWRPPAGGDKAMLDLLDKLL